MKIALILIMILLGAMRCEKPCWSCRGNDNSIIPPPSCHASTEEIKKFEAEHQCRCSIPD